MLYKRDWAGPGWASIHAPLHTWLGLKWLFVLFHLLVTKCFTDTPRSLFLLLSLPCPRGRGLFFIGSSSNWAELGWLSEICLFYLAFARTARTAYHSVFCSKPYENTDSFTHPPHLFPHFRKETRLLPTSVGSHADHKRSHLHCALLIGAENFLVKACQLTQTHTASFLVGQEILTCFSCSVASLGNTG
jgi:hypothetical protein